jgi:hypothetical protein
MRPLAALSPEEARSIEGLITDLDDTVLDHGTLTEEAYRALWAAERAGLPVLAATGRPAGWGEVIARQWPVTGAVTENGAVSFVREGSRLRRVERVTLAERAARRRRLDDLVSLVAERFPGVGLADDNGLRVSDVAFDLAESGRVSPEEAARLTAFLREQGFRTTRSSIHLHASLDGDDKASGALWFLGSVRGIDPARALARWAFVGDSGNDAACFSAFRWSFGVANVAPWVGGLSRPPRHVAPSARGAGFAEVVAALVAGRGYKTM